MIKNKCLCIKNFNILGKTIFKKDNEYEYLYYVETNMIYVNIDNNKVYSFTEKWDENYDPFEVYFLNKKEYRKLKIKKLNEKR